MSIDERFDWIGKNLESLHASSQELHASSQELRASVFNLRETVREMNETTNERFRTLVRILELHEQRLQAIKSGPKN